MLILVTYDVETVTPKGRHRLQMVAKACKNYGQRVQNSVFECVVDYTQYTQLKIELRSLIDTKTILSVSITLETNTNKRWKR